MPHLTLEYTGNLPGLDVQQALAALNAALLESGHFEGPDIKSRALRLADYSVGDGAEAGAFAHVTLRLLSGRTSQVRATLASSLLAALCRFLRADLSASAQVSVEVIELDRSSYVKAQVNRPQNLRVLQ